MERKEFGEPVQTARVVGAAYGIHRTTLTQAVKAGYWEGARIGRASPIVVVEHTMLNPSMKVL